MERGQLYPGKHKPVINYTEFERLQQILGRSTNTRAKQYTFTYRGLLRCGACGLAVTAEHKTNRFGSKYIYYHCTRKHRTWKCRQPSIEGRSLQQQMRTILERIYTPDAIHTWGSRKLERETVNFQATQEDRTKKLEHTIRDTETQVSNLTDIRIRGLIDDVEYEEKRSNLQQTIVRLNESLSRSCDEAKMFESQRLLLTFTNRAIFWFDMGCDEVKRRIIETVCSNPVLIDKIVSVEARKPFRMRTDVTAYPLLRVETDDVRTFAPNSAELKKEKLRITSMLDDAAELHAEPEMQDIVANIRWLVDHCEAPENQNSSRSA